MNGAVVSGVLGGGLAAGLASWSMIRQCRKPSGLLGRFILRLMNQSHSQLISWGLSHVNIQREDTVLDIGCGGGVTIRRVAGLAAFGRVYGVDYSTASVAASTALNRAGVESGQVAIQRATVSRLPFSDGFFHLVTAVETHYYWPDLPGDIQEIRRVLKPGGSLLVVAETYKSGGGRVSQVAMKPLGGALLTPEEHRDWFEQGGYVDVQVFLERSKGWICVTGRKPQ
jgi:SAM-dependent methyltransferase